MKKSSKSFTNFDAPMTMSFRSSSPTINKAGSNQRKVKMYIQFPGK